ncbi:MULTISPECIES: hypothetical protein [Streptomyces violaceoruber group]|uniref:hypothetical protein n=1 Tax=Streptomyces violaceoruber group TaxID=2867121 RepID=UPI003417335B
MRSRLWRIDWIALASVIATALGLVLDVDPEAVALAVLVANLYAPPSGVNGNLDDPSSLATEERRRAGGRQMGSK